MRLITHLFFHGFKTWYVDYTVYTLAGVPFGFWVNQIVCGCGATVFKAKDCR